MKNLLRPTILASGLLFFLLPTTFARAGTWSVGLGAAIAPSPFVGTDGYEVQPIPFIAYEGDRFNAMPGEASFRLLGGDRWSLELDGGIRFEGLDPKSASRLAGLEARKPAVDLGVSFDVTTKLGILEIGARTDVSGVHRGQEAKVAWYLPLGGQRILVAPGAGVVWKSRDLVDYYYGVRPDEATAELPAYRGEAATNPFVSLLGTFRITDRLWVLGEVTAQRLDDSITDSPIVELDVQMSGTLGLLVRLGGSGAPKWGRP